MLPLKWRLVCKLPC